MSNNTLTTCPYCKTIFDAQDAVTAFPVKITGKAVSLCFALCSDCYTDFERGDPTIKAKVIKSSVSNVLQNQKTDWAVTSSLALVIHANSFFNAWWIGVDLPDFVIEAINDGLIVEFAIIPGIMEVTFVYH
jgi:hypothetical protein